MRLVLEGTSGLIGIVVEDADFTPPRVHRRPVPWTWSRAAASLLLSLFVLGVQPASAASLSFEAVNLLDTLPGQDLWRYVYTLSDTPLEPNQGFAVFFDSLLYASLANPTPDTDAEAFVSTVADWDVLLLQPEPLIASGVFDALALLSSPTGGVFTVDFLWSGTGSPGSQSFYTYQLDELGAVQILESGATTAASPVPEPGSLLLLSSGCVALFVRRLWRRSV